MRADPLPISTEHRLLRTDKHRLLRYAFLGISILVLLPVLALVITAFQEGAGIWAHLLGSVIPRYAMNTVMLMLLTALFSTVIGVSTAWFVSCHDLPGRHILDWALMLPFALPAYILGFIYVEWLDYAGPVQSALREMMGWRSRQDYVFPEIRSLWGAACILSLALYPYVYLFARASFRRQSGQMWHAARVLGRKPLDCFLYISLPMARPALAASLALVMMEVMNDYGTVQHFAIRTFSTGIVDVYHGLNSIVDASRLAILALVCVGGLVVLEQYGRQRHAYIDRFSGFGERLRLPVRKSIRPFVVIWCWLPVVLGFVLPISALSIWTLQGWSLFSDQTFWSFLVLLIRSMGLAGAAALVVVAVALLFAYVHRWSLSTPGTHWLLHVSALGYAIPGSVLAVAVIIPLAGLDRTLHVWSKLLFDDGVGLLFSGTVAALIFAYLVRFLAVALGGIRSGMSRINPNLDHAAQILGHGTSSVVRKVHLPILRISLFSALLLVFVDVLKELPMTLLLRPFDFSTLATHVYELASDERFHEAAPEALLLTLVGMIPVILLVRRRDTRS